MNKEQLLDLLSGLVRGHDKNLDFVILLYDETGASVATCMSPREMNGLLIEVATETPISAQRRTVVPD